MVGLAGDGGARPNSRTMESGLEACGVFGELPSRRCLHGYALKAGIADCPLVVSVLFSMYSKCDNTGCKCFVHKVARERHAFLDLTVEGALQGRPWNCSRRWRSVACSQMRYL
jgi:hypothetical protein